MELTTKVHINAAIVPGKQNAGHYLTPMSRASIRLLTSQEIKERRKISHRISSAKRRKEQYEKIRAITEKARIKYSYGITKEFVDAEKAKLDGYCPICKRHKEKLEIDHDHVTGNYRGIICHSCNMSLGLCNDNPEILLGLVDYLMQTSKEYVVGRNECVNE